MLKSFLAFFTLFGILVAEATLFEGCSTALNTGSTTQPSLNGVGNLKQQLLVADGLATELYQAGFISSSELTTFNSIYGAATSALTEYSTDLANGDQPGADLALAAFNGYLQQLGQKTTVGKTRKANGTKAPSTQPMAYTPARTVGGRQLGQTFANAVFNVSNGQLA